MVKVLWISDFVAPTGFSRVSHSIIKFLPKDIYDIYCLGVNYSGDPHEYDLKIFPATGESKQDLYGFLRLPSLLNFIKPDLIFILNDAWIQQTYLAEIKKFYGENKLPKIVTYTPVDALDHDGDWYGLFDMVTVPVAYTEFGKEVILKATDNHINPRVILHGVDKEKFFRIPTGRRHVRLTIFGHDNLHDRFIVFNGNRNQPRKRLDITIKAFAEFAKDKDNVSLYLHCGVIDSHIDILKFAVRHGIDNKLILTGIDGGIQRLTTESLNLVYNACDVGINTGLGEGFGLVSIEHAMTGAPQITGNFSASREIYKDVGLLIDPITEWTIDKIGTTGLLVSPDDVVVALNTLYNDKELYNKLAEKGIEKFSADRFSWKHISNEWHDLFQSIL